jgi:hypothetical protein
MHIVRNSLLFACAFALTSSRAMGQTTCHTSDADGDHFKRILQQMMTPANAGLRTAVGVPQVDSTQISLVSDPVICARAGQAVDSLATVWAPTTHGPHPSTASLYVFRVGTSYGVIYLHPASTADGDPILFFDAAWSYTGTTIS